MKKRLFIVFFLNVSFISWALSQGKELSGYLFGDFRDAVVYFKNGITSEEKIDYNLLDKKIYFIDRSDSSVKVVSDMEQIRLVKTGKRNFIYVQGSLQEALPTTPPIYVEYAAKGRFKPPVGAYGGRSETSAVTSYSGLNSGGTYYKLEGQEMEISGYYNNYWIENDGKKKKFTSFKQFLKIYPDHKDALEKYIKDNDININHVDEVVTLCLYAESLYGN